LVSSIDRQQHGSKGIGEVPNVKYYAHTAEGSDGEPDPDQGRWQLLSSHLRNVANLAKRFAAPLGLPDEAELAGMLHDLGKYREEALSTNGGHQTVKDVFDADKVLAHG